MFPSHPSHRNIATLAMPLDHPTSRFSSVANVFALDSCSLHNHDGPKPSCCICYCAYGHATMENEAEYPTQLVCGHVFGTRCIRLWARTKSTCPLCRAELMEAEQFFFKTRVVLVDEDVRLFETPVARDLRYSAELGDYCTNATEYISSRSASGSCTDGESEDGGSSWQEDAGSVTSGESGDEFFSPWETAEQATVAEPEDEYFDWQEDGAAITDSESEDAHSGPMDSTGDASEHEYFSCHDHLESRTTGESDADTDIFFDAQEAFDMPEEVQYCPHEDIWLTVLYGHQHARATPLVSLLDDEPPSTLADNVFDVLVEYHSQWMAETRACVDSDEECEVGFHDVYPY
jgi:hypothetical protein